MSAYVNAPEPPLGAVYRDRIGRVWVHGQDGWHSFSSTTVRDWPSLRNLPGLVELVPATDRDEALKGIQALSAHSIFEAASWAHLPTSDELISAMTS